MKEVNEQNSVKEQRLKNKITSSLQIKCHYGCKRTNNGSEPTNDGRSEQTRWYVKTNKMVCCKRTKL